MFDELELIQQQEVDDSLRIVISCVAVESALAMMKNGNTAGSSDILPEMLKAGHKNRDFVDMLTALVNEGVTGATGMVGCHSCSHS